MSSAVQAGQTWRNKKTGVVTTVIGVPDRGPWGYVAHRGKRLTHTSLAQFTSKYERIEGEPA